MIRQRRRDWLVVWVASVVVLVVAACNNGTQPAATGPSGRALDCASGLVVTEQNELMPDALGFASPEAAIDAQRQLEPIPAGVLSRENPPPRSEASDTFVVVTDAGARVGYFDMRQTGQGWQIVQSEYCGGQ